MKRYRALFGLSLPGGRRVEAGEVMAAEDLPRRSLGWLVDSGYIEEVNDAWPLSTDLSRESTLEDST